MADKIRGITIEIGGDTKGLTKSLKDVNSKIGSTKDQLRDVDKLLKLDPTNIELLQQKEKLLNDTVAETSNKLRELEELQNQMDTAGVDHQSEQYLALQREIISTKSAYDSAKGAADSYNAKLEQVAAKSQQVADKSAMIAEKTWGITAAIAAMGIGAVTTTADFDEKMSQLAATMGVSTDEIGELREFAKEMGATTAFSASEAAEGLNVLAMSGLNAEEQMAVLPSVLNLAAAGGIDMATAASYVVGSIKGFGDEMSSASTYADLMAKGATLAATDVDGLGEALSGVAANASAYNQSADEMTKACLMLADQNVTGSEAVTSLNGVMRDLYTPTSAAAKQIRKLGVSAYDAEGNARPLCDVVADLDAATEGMSDKKKAGVLKKIFSDEGMKTFNKMCTASTESIAKFEEGLDNAGGSAGDQASTMLDNLNGQLTLLKSALEGAAISIGEKLMPYIEKFVEWIQKAVDWFNGLSDGQLKFLLILAGVIASIAPIAGIVSKISTAVGFLSKNVLPKLKKESGFLKANPFLLIVTAVVTLVTLIGKNADKIREYLQKVDDFLQGVFEKDFTEIFGEKLGGALNKFFDGFKVVWDGFKKVLDWVINICEKMVNGDWAGVWEDLKNLFKPAIDWIQEKWQALCDFITNLLDGDFTAAFGEESTFGQALTNFSSWVSGIWDDITGFFQGAYDTVSALFSGDFSAVFGEGSAIRTAFDGVKTFFSDTWDSITGFFSGAYDTVSGLFDGDFSSIFGEGSTIRTAFDGVKGFFSDTWDTITKNFTDSKDSVKTLLEGDFSDLFKEGSPIRTAFDGAKKFFGDTWETIKTNFTESKDAVDTIWNTDFTTVFGEGSLLGEALNTFRDGISEKMTAVEGFFTNAKDNIKGILEGDFSCLFGEESVIGKALNGFKDLFDSIFGEEGIKADVQSVLDWITGTFTGAWDTAWEGLKSGVTDIWDGVTSAVKKPINSVIDLINKMVDKVNGWIDSINGISLFGMSLSIGKLSKITKLAKGGVVPMGGTALVGERGPEMLTVSNGHATVTPLGGGSSGGNTINVYAQEMTEAQVDYLINRVNRGLIYA